MSIFTIFGGQTQQQTDRSRAETIARQYQQGQNPPMKDVAWVAKNYPDLLQRGPSPQGPTYQAAPKGGPVSGWTYTGPLKEPTLPASSFTGVPTGVSVKYYDTSPKLVSGFDLGSVGKGLEDLGSSLGQKGLAGTMLSWQTKPLLQESKVLPPPSSFPLISQIAYTARKQGANIPTPTTRPLALEAGIVAPFESLAYVGPRLFGVKTPSPPPTVLGGLIGMPFGSKEYQKAAAYGPEYQAGTLLGEAFLGYGLGKAGSALWEALPTKVTDPLERLGSFAWEKTVGRITGPISERAEEYLTTKYISSAKGVSTFLEEGGEPTVEGIQEWRGLSEKAVMFITGAKPSGLAVGEVMIPDVPLEEQLRLAQFGIGKEPQDIAMEVMDFTIAPRTGGVAYTKPLLTAVERESEKLAVPALGITKGMLAEEELTGGKGGIIGFEKTGAEKWSDIGKTYYIGERPELIDVGFAKVPYRAGFSAQYGFEKAFFPPETGLTPLVTQSQLTRMGIFPDIPSSIGKIPSMSEDVSSHLASLAGVGASVLRGLSLGLVPKDLAKSFAGDLAVPKAISKPSSGPMSFSMPVIWPEQEERTSQAPIAALIPGEATKEIVTPRLIVPTFPAFPTTPEKGLPPISFPRLGGGERTFGGRKMRGRWIPLTHAIPSFGMVAKHFGIKGFGTRGISGDRSGPGYEPPMNKLFQASIAGYGKRGPIRESNKVPVSYKGMRMRDRIKRHERVERKLRLNGTSYPAAHRRALREEHKGLTRKQINVYEGKVRSIKHEIENSDNGDPFKRLMRKLAA